MRPLAPSDRREPLPSFVGLPARAWRRGSRGGRIAVVCVALLALVAGVVAWPHVTRTKKEGARAEAAAYLQRWRAEFRRIDRAQQPRRVRVAPARAGASQAAGAMRGAIVAALGGDATCTTMTATARAPLRLDCLRRTGRTTGIPYRAAGDPRTGVAALCRDFPPPGHPDTANVVAIPLDPVCTGERSRGPVVGRDLRSVSPEQLVRLWERG